MIEPEFEGLEFYENRADEIRYEADEVAMAMYEEAKKQDDEDK